MSERSVSFLVSPYARAGISGGASSAAKTGAAKASTRSARVTAKDSLLICAFTSFSSRA